MTTASVLEVGLTGTARQYAVTFFGVPGTSVVLTEGVLLHPTGHLECLSCGGEACECAAAVKEYILTQGLIAVGEWPTASLTVAELEYPRAPWEE